MWKLLLLSISSWIDMLINQVNVFDLYLQNIPRLTVLYWQYNHLKFNGTILAVSSQLHLVTVTPNPTFDYKGLYFNYVITNQGGTEVPQKGDNRWHREGGGGLTKGWCNLCMRMNKSILVKNLYTISKKGKTSSIFYQVPTF